MTIAEAARLTGLTNRAIEARIERGTLPAELREGRRRIPLAALYDAGLIAMQPGAVVSELLDRLEAQAQELGRLQAELDEAT